MTDATTSKKYKVLVIDDESKELEAIQTAFERIKTEWATRSTQADCPENIKAASAVLNDMELVTVHNKSGSQADIIGDVAKRVYKGEFAAIISDYLMPTDEEYEAYYFDYRREPDNYKGEYPLVHTLAGGAQLAKIAKIVDVPLVIYTGGDTELTTNTIHAHLKPASDVPEFKKDKYEDIFLKITEMITQKEKAVQAQL